MRTLCDYQLRTQKNPFNFNRDLAALGGNIWEVTQLGRFSFSCQLEPLAKQAMYQKFGNKHFVSPPVLQPDGLHDKT